MAGVLAQLNVSQGGMPKLPVLFARVSAAGVDGDRQRNKTVHGGPNRAVCVYSEELYEELRDAGVDVSAGSIGENFTTRGIDLRRLAKRDRLRVGADCVIEITDVRVPCRQLRMWDPELPELIVGRRGGVARVITEGVVKAGDVIEVVAKRNE